MHKGIVKWFNRERGYGFIKVPGRSDAMVHKSFLVPDMPRKYLITGEVVEFDLYEGKPHYLAKNVRIMDKYT